MFDISYKLLSHIPEYKWDYYTLYPDIILYDCSQHQYQHRCKVIERAPYLIYDGIELRPTNFVMFAFQTIKGWLGFTNFCQPQWVDYGKKKLDYYGYIKGYTLSTLSTDACRYDEESGAFEWQQAVRAPRSDNNSVFLQKQLLNAYHQLTTIAPRSYFPIRLSEHFRFGDHWKPYNAFEAIAMLDPQDAALIDETIQSWDRSHNSKTPIPCLENSLFARTIAQFYLNKAKTLEWSGLQALLYTDPRMAMFEMALHYHANIEYGEEEQFIPYFVESEQISRALDAIERLTEEEQKRCFLLSIPEDSRIQHIAKDSTNALILAHHHIAQGEYEKASWYTETLADISPSAAFHLAIEQKAYLRAYRLLKDYPSIEPSTFERLTLSQGFSDTALSLYEKGHSYLVKQSWQSAKAFYHKSMIAANTAHAVLSTEDTQESMYEHQRLYAQVLISEEELLYPDPRKSDDVSALYNAQRLLEASQSNDDDELHLLNKAKRRVYIRLMEHFEYRISSDHALDHGMFRDYTKNNLSHIQALETVLNKLIATFPQKPKAREDRLILGKAHYLLADLQEYFHCTPSVNVHHHHEKAWQMVPDNPIYFMRRYEINRDTLKHLESEAIIRMKRAGIQMIEYIRIWDERWTKPEKKIFDPKDFHIDWSDLQPAKNYYLIPGII